MTTELVYRDAAAPLEERVADLLARMTLQEKVAQLRAVWGFEIVPNDRLDETRLAALLADGIGEISRLAGSTNLRPNEIAPVANRIQRYLVEQTRLGIPAIVHEESLHGLLAWGAACFQQAIGAAASFDPDLLADVARVIGRRMLASGAQHSLAPVLDITRDPRWGRIEETYGEDPYLATAMGLAYIRAIQEPVPGQLILATGKHMVGHGLPDGGLNQGPVHVGWRELRDEHLLPFEAAVREAGLGSVMPAYCDVDGMPCHASAELLVDVLRGEWGFDGMVASDYMGIEQLADQHRVTADMAGAAAMALAAGVDIELPSGVAYCQPLIEAIEDGRVDCALVDRSVARILAAKLRLGLFERPYREEASAEELRELASDEQRLGRELARRSIVLLENRGILPLASDPGRVAVIGPIADSTRELLGDYSHLVHIETLLEVKRNVFGLAGAEVSLDDELSGRTTIVAALRQHLGSERVGYARGATLRGGTDAQIEEAVELARASDIALLILGERSGLTNDSTTGEFRDRHELGLMGRQQELLEAVVETGTPTVLVVVSGRPLALEWAARHCAAVLFAWVPGDEGPAAIVDVLSGEVNPGGKLPVTVPRSVGQVPLSYRHHPSGGRSNPKGDYVDGPTSPLWPFGFGRSYSEFELSDLRVSAAQLPTEGGEVLVSATLANVGERAGEEVVQLYLRDEEASVARPVRQLAGFRRVALAAGDRVTVSFALHAEQLAYTGADYRRVIEPGRVTLWLGTSAADLPLKASVELVGQPVELRERRHFVTRSWLSSD